MNAIETGLGKYKQKIKMMARKDQPPKQMKIDFDRLIRTRLIVWIFMAILTILPAANLFACGFDTDCSPGSTVGRDHACL